VYQDGQKINRKNRHASKSAKNPNKGEVTGCERIEGVLEIWEHPALKKLEGKN